MKNKKRILVVGYNDVPGESVAKALLADERFRIRILLEDTRSSIADVLIQAGAEVAEGSLDNARSLMLAMEDCYGVFGTTSFAVNEEEEFRLGKNLVDSVASSPVQHFVFRSQDNYCKLSNGSLPVPSFDVKAKLQDYIKELKLPATFVQASFYYEDFLSTFGLQNDNEGGYSFGFPQGNTRLGAVSADDYGKIVRSIFHYPVEYIGRLVRAVGADETCMDYAAILSEVLGVNVTYQYIPAADYATLGFAGAAEIANRFEVQRLYIPNRKIDLIESYGLNPGMQHFRGWVIKNKKKIIDSLWLRSAVKAVA